MSPCSGAVETPGIPALTQVTCDSGTSVTCPVPCARSGALQQTSSAAPATMIRTFERESIVAPPGTCVDTAIGVVTSFVGAPRATRNQTACVAALTADASAERHAAEREG